jgi:hypothetical protein
LLQLQAVTHGTRLAGVSSILELVLLLALLVSPLVLPLVLLVILVSVVPRSSLRFVVHATFDMSCMLT